MFSLQSLLGEDDKFLVLLERSVEECRHSVQSLKKIVGSGDAPLNLNEFTASRRSDKQITTEIAELLCRVSVTGFEREDIEALSNALYKIPKTVEKFAARYIRCRDDVKDVNFTRQVALIEQAVEIISEMLKELRKKYRLEELKQRNFRLQQVEAEADDLILDLMEDLYSRKHDAIRVIMLKDLFEMLEKVVDRCRDAGNVISHIILKNS
jgi:hypothetical protein